MKYSNENEKIQIGSLTLEGSLIIPENALGLVIFVHGSGSSRHSPRNNFVAGKLREKKIGTLLLDLLTFQEDLTAENRFDIDLLAERLKNVYKWLQTIEDARNLSLGLFGASTGAAAALQIAAELKGIIKAVVSRGGRPDLALQYLKDVVSPTLLIVGGDDEPVIELNQKAYDILICPKEMVIIPGATHLFEEAGTLDKVADYASNWFQKYFN